MITTNAFHQPFGSRNMAMTESSNDAPKHYVSFGYLEPLFGKRIMDCLSRHDVRFTARDASFLDVATIDKPSYLSARYSYPRWARHNLIELFVYNDDQDLARQVIDKM
ncbi:MAG: hypothetical protein ABR611_06860 [Chthoniobacterales bacterium]